MGNLKTRYRKLQAFADGGAVVAGDAPQVTATPIPEPVVEPDDLDKAELPASAKAWLRKHDEFLYDPDASAKLADMHWQLVDEGRHEPYSEPYFQEIERRLEQPEPAQPDVDTEAVDRVLAQARRSSPPRPEAEDDAPRIRYSAPPSREVRSSNGSRYLSNDPRSITLTQEQKAFAKIAGCSEQEYARQVLRLRQEKEFGNYGGQP